MAKSIRSKHRRRMRSTKRDKFDKKVLTKLKESVSRDVLNNPDVDMSDIATVKTASEIKEQQSTSKEDSFMALEGSSSKDFDGSSSKDFDKKTKRNENGQYPQWMNQRSIRKEQLKNKKVKKKKGRSTSKTSAW
eukprot:TRINITY_DN38196_c0_g1_i2.p3 TRINITY_DN38196_c0_g1~~TRINITY_DN38196_c0_g1_i2.p3  ORF type:complete len:150 (-),score=42.55 TRINITY_DN38196_c0_g1_i2:129-530(-)